MVRIRFTQPNGKVQEIEAETGETLMANACAQGIDGIIAECGGCLVCGTCHVYVAGPWFELLDPPSTIEADILDYGLHRQPSSRLSCQIMVTDTMDGMEVGVPLTQR
ncbi:2Fe-2S iron-sulfur cluster-binding protein [Novosphingobium sp.]|uniref:2Fe-2S iron-sulfur cluster-binding protein n=1 Tax=Novosphingobium sp. TaxID=1874826 RepID=UPI00261E4B6F|nr:2Fe-2S iron-sulfur cluster-binding protein [Novosphingobium sp.]